MDTATRSWAESRFGYDFGSVRVHDDERSAVAARSLGAKAFTLGRHVVVDPSVHAGERRRLMAHELTHVIQQRDRPEPGSSWRLGEPTSAAEREARANVARAAGDAHFEAAARTPAVLQRNGEDEEIPAEIESDRDVRLTPYLSLNQLGLTLDFLQGRHRFGVGADLTNPTNLLTSIPGIGPSTFAASIFYSNRCNEAFQAGILQYSQRQQPGGPVLSGGNPWSLSGAFGLRFGSLYLAPGLDFGFRGNQLDSFGVTLSIIPNVDPTIPPECLPTRIPHEDPRTPSDTPGRTPDHTPNGDRPGGGGETPQSPMLAPMTIYYYYDEAIRRMESNSTVDLILRAMRLFPDLRVRLTGHTSLEGRERYNRRLSRNRAEAARDDLLMAGIDRSRIEVFWLGEHAPAVYEPPGPRGEEPPHSFSGPLESLRDLNRRVEVEFIDPTGRVAPSTLPLQLHEQPRRHRRRP